MKKLAITLCVLGLLSTSSAFAYYQEEHFSEVPTVKGMGYSNTMTKMTETFRIRNTNTEVEPYYSLDPYANCETEQAKWYTVIKRWFDPLQDDQLFGRHEIEMTNGWFENDPVFVGKNKVEYPNTIQPVGRASIDKGSIIPAVEENAANETAEVIEVIEEVIETVPAAPENGPVEVAPETSESL